LNDTYAHRPAESHALTVSVRDVSKPPIGDVVTAWENVQFEPAVAVPAEAKAVPVPA